MTTKNKSCEAQEGDYIADFTREVHVIYTKDSIDVALDKALIRLLTARGFRLKYRGHEKDQARRDMHFIKYDCFESCAGTA